VKIARSHLMAISFSKDDGKSCGPALLIDQPKRCFLSRTGKKPKMENLYCLRLQLDNKPEYFYHKGFTEQELLTNDYDAKSIIKNYITIEGS